MTFKIARVFRVEMGNASRRCQFKEREIAMLRFTEEIILLLLNDDDGRFARLPNVSLDYALAGGVLMDLALENRIDTDLDNLILIDETPTGDSLLDPTLADIAEVGGNDARFWVERTAVKASELREEALRRLIEQGILEQVDDRFMWVFKSRRYPTIDGQAQREVKLRIMGVLFSDEIPDPRDIVIICLADACGIFKTLLSSQELESVTPRIDQVKRLDLIGQAMTQAIQDIELTLAAALQPHMY
ncbi:MAG: GPP34 family phosphoprotein [Chloroflexi bacterium]|nr:GPP34 family phosphoprotein [Chloroflexota bacterium]